MFNKLFIKLYIKVIDILIHSENARGAFSEFITQLKPETVRFPLNLIVFGFFYFGGIYV